MTSLEVLRARPSADIRYLLLLDGCPFAFTDEPEISDQWEVDVRRIVPGLIVPSKLKISLDLERGMLQGDTVNFQILDSDGTIPTFLGSYGKTFSLLGYRLKATDDPAPLSLFDQNGDPLTLWDTFLGLEAIGPAGERHYYSACPWFSQWPGEDNPISEPLPISTTSSTGPYLVEGRRVMLYRIYKDDDGTWKLPTDEDEAKLSLLWWGTLRQDGSVEGQTWTLSCVGPASWLTKTLNARGPTDWFRVNSVLALSADESKIYLYFYRRNGFTSEAFQCGRDWGVTYTVSVGDPATVSNSIATAITAVKGAAGVDGIWTNDAPIANTAAQITWTLDAVTVWTTANPAGWASLMTLGLHYKVWRFLGYDPVKNVANVDAPEPYFYMLPEAPGYYFGYFGTVPVGDDYTPKADGGWDGDGIPRIYNPTSSQGGITVLPGSGDFGVTIHGTDFPDIYVEGQTSRPYHAATLDPGDCNSTRWWAFKGKIQYPAEDGDDDQPDPADTIQLARCSWVDSVTYPGNMAKDFGGLKAPLWVGEWLDPKLYGCNYREISPSLGWAANQVGEEGAVYCSPLAVLGVWNDKTDRVDWTFLRLLLSTGTASYADSGLDDPGDGALLANYPDYSYLDAGYNHPPGLPNSLKMSGDVEIADFGLCIPYQMVEELDIETGNLPVSGTVPTALLAGKVVFHGAVQSQDVIESLLAPRGWWISLKNKRYGLQAPHLPLGVDDADLVIREEDLAGDGGDPSSCIPQVELRPVQPFDRLKLAHTNDPTSGFNEGQEEKLKRARDPGARARLGVRSRDVIAPDLRALEWWEGDIPAGVQAWEVDFSQLWEHQIAGWLAEPHRLIRNLKISRIKGQDLYPGAIVRFTNPWPANSTGTYGYINAMARIVSVEHDTADGSCTIEALVQSRPAQDTLRWAPIVLLIDGHADPEDRYDPVSRVLTLSGDCNGQEQSTMFVEPVDSSTGELAKVLVLQYDGDRWRQTASGFIESANFFGPSITFQAPGPTGVIYERMYGVVVFAPYNDPDQASWVKSRFAWHGTPGTLNLPKLLP